VHHLTTVHLTPFPLARGLMRVLGTVVQRAVLPKLHARQYFPLGSIVAFELLGDDDPWHIR
jgi:hypothetical protein